MMNHNETDHNRLDILAPTSAEQRPKPPHLAYADLRRTINQKERERHATSGSSRTARFGGFLTMFKQNQLRWAVSLVMIALLAGAFAFPGTRAAASSFLGLFRVQKFAPISVSPEQLARLEDLDLDGLVPAEMNWVEEPGEPVEVATMDDALEQTGLWYSYNLNESLGEPVTILVGSGGFGELTIDLDTSRQILEVADIDPALLPDSLDGADINVEFPDAVITEYSDSTALIQMSAPSIRYPDGFDPAPIGQAVLQLLGMEEGEAYRLASSIDWTNTLLLPVPTDIATFQEVQVDGTIGILISELDGEYSTLMWENTDMLFMISHEGDAESLMALVNS